MDNTPIILSENDIASLKGKHGVVLFYMNGCNPCNMIKPHWNKAIEELKNDVGEEIILGAIEREKLNSFNNHINVNRHVNGFPTILYLHPSNHNSPEVYKGNREHKDIKEWILEKKNRSSGAKKHNKHMHIEKKRSNSRGYQGGGGGSRGSSKHQRKSRRRTSKRRSGSRMYRRRKGMRKTKTARMSKRRQSGGGCGCGSSSSIFNFLKNKPKQQQQEQ